MDLHNLLNSQKESNLSFTELKDLLSKRDTQAALDKIQSTTAFVYPSDKQEAFQFFDTFIQLVLFISSNDKSQYTKSVVIDSLHKCINGLLKKYGISWLKEFPCYFTQATWTALKTNSAILVLLYGMVLALMKKPDTAWIHGILQFMQSDSSAILAHLWLNVCCVLDEDHPKELYLETLEMGLLKNTTSVQRVQEMIGVLKDVNMNFIAKKIDQELGNALARPPFTRDEYVLGYISLESYCLSGRYLSISKIYQQKTKSGMKTNIRNYAYSCNFVSKYNRESTTQR